MRFYGGASPLVWVDIPEPLRDGLLLKIPQLSAEEDLRAFTVAMIANTDCDAAYRTAVLAGLNALAYGRPTQDKRPDGTWIVKTGDDLRRFFQVEGGFAPAEVA